MSKQSGVASNLCGLYVKGIMFLGDNPEYVAYGDRKKNVTYTKIQTQTYLWQKVTSEIVAVDHHVYPFHDEPSLRLWVLHDGKLRYLHPNLNVMPRGWQPELR